MVTPSSESTGGVWRCHSRASSARRIMGEWPHAAVPRMRQKSLLKGWSQAWLTRPPILFGSRLRRFFDVQPLWPLIILTFCASLLGEVLNAAAPHSSAHQPVMAARTRRDACTCTAAGWDFGAPLAVPLLTEMPGDDSYGRRCFLTLVQQAMASLTAAAPPKEHQPVIGRISAAACRGGMDQARCFIYTYSRNLQI